MMEERNAYAGQTAAADRPYLARINDLADEAARTGDYIQDFIDRCRGGGPDEAKSTVTPVPSGHFGQLERLQSNMARVDALARELGTIG